MIFGFYDTLSEHETYMHCRSDIPKRMSHVICLKEYQKHHFDDLSTFLEMIYKRNEVFVIFPFETGFLHIWKLNNW